MDLLKCARAPQVGAVRLVLLPILFLSLFCSLALLVAIVAMRGEGQSQAAAGEAESEAESGPGNTLGRPEENTDITSVTAAPGDCIIFRNHKRCYPTFIERVVQVARNLGTDPNFLMMIMSLESGFDPARPNGMHCIGLIQFCPKTQRALHVTFEELAGMNAVTQMRWVEAYYHKSNADRRDPMRSPGDAYMVNFVPAYRHYSMGAAFGRAPVGISCKEVKQQCRRYHPQCIYCWNPGFDHEPHDGTITKVKVFRVANKRYNEGLATCGRGRRGSSRSQPIALKEECVGASPTAIF